jgi:hypothetical protein
MPKKKYARKPPEPVVTGRCEICNARAFYGFSNRGWQRKEFCGRHIAEGETYWSEINEH